MLLSKLKAALIHHRNTQKVNDGKRRQIDRCLGYKRKRFSSFTFIDLFAGIGGFRQAATSNGGECVFSSEINKEARLTYHRNYSETPHGDITKIDAKDIPKHDVLLGGFPCQSFSIAGLRKGFDDPTKGTLFFDICRIAKYHKPSVLVLENVKGIMHHDKGRTLKVIITTLEEIGYTVSVKVLNAVNFGLPQNRERAVFVASLGKKFDFDKLKHLPRVTVKDVAYGDHTTISADKYTLIDKRHVKVQPKSNLIFAGFLNGKTLRAGYKNISAVSTHRSQFGIYDTNGSCRTIIATLHPYYFKSSLHKQSSRIYSESGSSPTLVAEKGDRNKFLHNDVVINANVQTLYAIQGFPKTFKIHSVKTHAIRQVGNSIPVPMLEQVISEVVKQGLIEKRGRKHA